jgi:hypothetical protein
MALYQRAYKFLDSGQNQLILACSEESSLLLFCSLVQEPTLDAARQVEYLFRSSL